MIEEKGNEKDATPENNRWLNWLRKMWDKGCITEAMYHQMYGRWSGYSECCIDWFCLLADFNPDLQVHKYTSRLFGDDSHGIDYVRCPKCRRKNNEE